MEKVNRKELPDLLANKARKIAYKKKVSTNSILEPMLVEHGFEDENGFGLEIYCITVGMDEDLDKVPTKEVMKDFNLTIKK